MIKLVGKPTVNVILQRAIWDAGKKISEVSLLEIRDGFLDTSNLKKIGDIEKEVEIINLVLSNIVEVLARIIGKDLARKITEELDEGEIN